MDIAYKLKVARESNNLSKNQLAKLAGISQSYVSDIEAGKKNPTLDIIERICSAMNVTVIQFLSDDTELSPDIIQLIETAKKLSSSDIKLVNQFITNFQGIHKN